MQMFLGILIGVGITSLIFLLVYFILNKSENISIDSFQKEQQKIIASINKKRDDYNLQMQKEVDAARQSAQIKIQHLQEEEQQAKERYISLQSQLENSYLEKQKWYNEQEQSAALARSEANEAEIAKAAHFKSESLRKLEEDYKEKSEILKVTFDKYSNDLKERKEQLDKEIQQYEDKQKAIIEQFKKDEETKQKQDFYHIKLNDVEKKDVAQLKHLALEFSKPEIIFKLLYEVYYKTRLEELFKRVLGENAAKGGIYKITNIRNQKIYIGKTTKFLDRWRTHSKRGCNIERISGQLYDAMFDEGIENFTFEIVEVCAKEEQSEKEKYWVDFYKSKEYGYNSRNGG